MEFRKRCLMMIEDIKCTQGWSTQETNHQLIKGDARRFQDYAAQDSLDMVVTSPPYLNNYDYGDRTRLETYFWGVYHSWGDITREVRDKLITAATTQIRRGEWEVFRETPTVRAAAPEIHAELRAIITQLSELRLVKRGRKAYDLMVAGYFEDMLAVVRAVHSVLKPGQPFILVVGDSAPYGVHVPTDELIGRLSLSVGFSGWDKEIIRTRGDKWAGNPQRHKVPLRESIVTIIK